MKWGKVVWETQLLVQGQWWSILGMQLECVSYGAYSRFQAKSIKEGEAESHTVYIVYNDVL